MAFRGVSWAATVTLVVLHTALAQVAPSDTETQLKKALEQIERLTNQLAAHEARIQQLEAERGSHPEASAGKVAIAPPVPEPTAPVATAINPVSPDATLKPSESQRPLPRNRCRKMLQSPRIHRKRRICPWEAKTWRSSAVRS
jgi:hypothetical protein